MKITIDHLKCKLSGECIKTCPEKAISIHEGKVVVNHCKCDLDGICIPACPHGAISYSQEQKKEVNNGGYGVRTMR